MDTKQLERPKVLDRQITEMADAHCHLDLISDPQIIRNAILNGVRTIITNGVDTKSNMRGLDMSDRVNVFPMFGIDPEHANASDEELEFNVGLVKSNIGKIIGIGEIGLDYGRVKETVPVERQKAVFERFLDLALELRMPVSIHSRNALDDVLSILDEKRVEMAHIHFFEGSVQQAKEIERKGYMVSIPPMQSSSRSRIIKEIAIDNIMAESDSPAAGASPMDVERSIAIVAEAKRIEFKTAAELLSGNTKRFFRLKAKGSFMRM